MKKTASKLVPILVFSSFSIPAFSLSPIFGVPDPLSGSNSSYQQQNFSLPAVGTQVAEPSFGLGLTKLTHAGSDGSRHEYSRFDPYNAGQSQIILNSSGGRASVYNTQTYPYNGVGNLVTKLPVVEARWDRNDANKIWGLTRFGIKTVNTVTGNSSVIKDFSNDPVLKPYLGSGASRITMKDEGESSYDKRYWAFVVQGDKSNDYKSQHIFTWDKQADKVLGVYTLKGAERNIDWVGMSPKGNHVLIGGLNYTGDENSENITGLTMASKDLSRFHRLDYTTAHADVGLDSNGNEVVIMQNTRTDYVDMIPVNWDTKAIKSASQGYEGTNRTKLVRLNYNDSAADGFQGGVHISANYDGHVLISTTLSSGKSEQNWLDKSLVLVKLDPDNPETSYLSKIYNTTDEYWQETHGTITNDGKRVVWAANGDQAGPGGDNNNFLLELDLVGTGIPENSYTNDYTATPTQNEPVPDTQITPKQDPPVISDEEEVVVVEDDVVDKPVGDISEPDKVIPKSDRWWEPQNEDGEEPAPIDKISSEEETEELVEDIVETISEEKLNDLGESEESGNKLDKLSLNLEADPGSAENLSEAEVAAVPLPGALLLMGSSLIGLLGASRKKVVKS